MVSIRFKRLPLYRSCIIYENMQTPSYGCINESNEVDQEGSNRACLEVTRSKAPYISTPGVGAPGQVIDSNK